MSRKHPSPPIAFTVGDEVEATRLSDFHGGPNGHVTEVTGNADNGGVWVDWHRGSLSPQRYEASNARRFMIKVVRS